MERKFANLDMSKLDGSSIENLLCKKMEALKVDSMDDELTDLFLRLSLADMNGQPNEEFIDWVKTQFEYQVIQSRVKCFQYNLSPFVATMLMYVTQSPGTAVMYLTFIQYLIKTRFPQWRGKTLSMEQFARLFPMGYFKSDDLLKIWDDTKVNNKGRGSDNLIDYMQYAESIMFSDTPVNYKVGDKVSLPMDEEGTIVEIKNIPWGHKYVVKIEKATLSTQGEKADFRYEDLTPKV